MFGEFPEEGRFNLRSFRADGSTEDLRGGAGLLGGGVGEGREEEALEVEVGEDAILGLELQQDSVSL